VAKISFIGVGNMGAPMANNLIKAGHELCVYDVMPACMQAVPQAKAAESAAQTLEGAEFVISMLPESRHVESLYIEQKLLEHINPSALVIDCSTISPASSRKVAAAAAERGISMIDAPVSGGTNGALNGTLTFIVGGQAADLERARPLLEAMGKNIFHAGDSGAGQVAKIANNMMLGIQMAGVCEALSLGVANGMDPKVLSDIMRVSSGGNWVLEKYNPWPNHMENTPASKDYAGGFGVDLMLKDLGLAAGAAVDSKSAITLGETARNLFALHSRNGHGRLDFSSIISMIRTDKDKPA
jgi:3-hydroxyisobutyrate dehydrogenase